MTGAEFAYQIDDDYEAEFSRKRFKLSWLAIEDPESLYLWMDAVYHLNEIKLGRCA